MKAIKTVSFIGSGNVATNLAKAFFENGLTIEYVYSQKMKNASLLANSVGSKSIDKVDNVNFKSDLIVIALKDDVIELVLKKITFNNQLIVHTSGSFNSEKLAFFSKNYGCFYPFQTFRKEIKADLSQIYFFIEANEKQNEECLLQLATLFSKQVVKMNSSERKSLHIAGVGVNNFTHYLLSMTKQYCEENNLKTDYLSDLLNQTINNSFYKENSLQLQTGPARRGDALIIKEHLLELDNTPKYLKVYKIISQLILDEFHEGSIKL